MPRILLGRETFRAVVVSGKGRCIVAATESGTDTRIRTLDRETGAEQSDVRWPGNKIQLLAAPVGDQVLVMVGAL